MGVQSIRRRLRGLGPPLERGARPRPLNGGRVILYYRILQCITLHYSIV